MVIPPTSNILLRTFLFRYAEKMGTCFFIHEDGKEYLITAKHNLTDLRGNVLVDSGDSIEIAREEGWISVKVVHVIQSELSDLDVISLVLPEQIVKRELIINCEGSFHYGWDVFLLGFPGILQNNNHPALTKWELSSGYPLPYIKKCIVSSANPRDGVPYIYLDTVANKGFSGGPVCFVEPDKTVKVIGVISRHFYESLPVMAEKSELSETARMYAGFSLAHGIKPIIDAVKKQPYGCPIFL